MLSSANPLVVAAAAAELGYHDRLLTALGLDRSHKIVLHVGSGSANAPAAGERLATAYAHLPDGVRARLVIENDERWSLERVLELARPLGMPVVFDTFHHQLAPSLPQLTTREAILAAAETWQVEDGRQEVHFSTQDPEKRPGAHARTLDLEAFAAFTREVGDLPLDCILEVKDKEQSVLSARRLLPVAA